MSLAAWARLVRIPTVFTILADVSAAFLLVSGGIEPVGRFVCVVLAGVCLYWSGMIFNDVFDIQQDLKERPTRPLPSGDISRRSAVFAGAGLMLAGILLAAGSGLIPADDYAANYRPGIIGIVLALAILLYDGPLKRTPLGPATMGCCRFLSFLLGASPVVTGAIGMPFMPQHVLIAAAGMGVYVMGVTLIARREASETTKQLLIVGIVVLTLGCLLMGFSPRFADANVRFRFQGDNGFALLIGMIGFTVVYRAVTLISDPSPQRVQMVVRIALLTLIPLAASFALLGAGAVAAGSIFALVIPAMLVSAKFRMT